MRKITIVTLALSLTIEFGLLISFFVVGLNKPAMAQEIDKCTFYENAYVNGNKQLSMISAKGFLDNSAPRETNRQLQALNEKIGQLIIIQQMQDIGCNLPEQTSSADYYGAIALACTLGNKSKSPECDPETWSFTADE